MLPYQPPIYGFGCFCFVTHINDECTRSREVHIISLINLSPRTLMKAPNSLIRTGRLVEKEEVEQRMRASRSSVISFV